MHGDVGINDVMGDEESGRGVKYCPSPDFFSFAFFSSSPSYLGCDCGQCSGSDSCVNNVCTSPDCAATCSSGGKDCGSYLGCNCGQCTGSDQCVNNVCTAPDCATTCSSGGKNCGTYLGCNCGQCTGSDQCVNNVCTAPDCAATCSSGGKNCGTYLGCSCGQCSGSDVCVSNVCQSCTASVSSVSPTSASLNQQTTFTVNGACLPTTIAAWIDQCENLAVTSTGATQAQFRCTPSYSTGVKQGLIKDQPGGSTLHSFTVNVTGCTPSVTSVTPTAVTLNQQTTFTVNGTCLPSTIAAWIDQCDNLVVTSTGATQAQFRCTPSYSTGTKQGLIKDAPNGATLYSFNVSVGACSPSVSSVTPTSATLNQQTTFTVNGSCLPSTIAPWIDQCANLTVTSTGATQAQFRCTPSYATGNKQGLIKDQPGGSTLYSFLVNVH